MTLAAALMRSLRSVLLELDALKFRGDRRIAALDGIRIQSWLRRGVAKLEEEELDAFGDVPSPCNKCSHSSLRNMSILRADVARRVAGSRYSCTYSIVKGYSIFRLVRSFWMKTIF